MRLADVQVQFPRRAIPVGVVCVVRQRDLSSGSATHGWNDCERTYHTALAVLERGVEGFDALLARLEGVLVDMQIAFGLEVLAVEGGLA